MKLIRLRSKRFSRSNSKLNNGGSAGNDKRNSRDNEEIKWEVRPGGMLVQRREIVGEKDFITIKVSLVSHWHDVSIGATSTFGELKMILSLVTGLEAREQRLLYRGKEREDNEHLHMVGVGDKAKVVLLQDPEIKETKLRGGFIHPPQHHHDGCLCVLSN
ncbi:hypothetical protein V2J09_000068 [Rumex salicifolius]